MKAITLLAVACCIAAVAVAPSNSQRMVGGSVTTIDQYPFIAALLYSDDLSSYVQTCVGTIINRRSILSAAHCFGNDAPNRWRSRVGSTYANSGGVVHNTESLIIHPLYNATTLNNDIAILRTDSTISFSRTVAAASIAGSNYNLGDNEVVEAIGWGATFSQGPPSEQLRRVQVWTVDQTTCRIRYGALGINITDNMVCTGELDVGGRDQCTGDSGGPLYHNDVIIGVASYEENCGQAFLPGINPRVSRFSSWIQSNA